MAMGQLLELRGKKNIETGFAWPELSLPALAVTAGAGLLLAVDCFSSREIDIHRVVKHAAE